MKLKISFVINTDNAPAYDCKKEKNVPEVLMNVGDLFARLQRDIPLRRLDLLSSAKNRNYGEDLLRGLKENIRNDEVITEQLFHDYCVEGELENGKKFIFTHKEPGYKEELNWI